MISADAVDWLRLRDAIVAHYRAVPAGASAAPLLSQVAARAAACTTVDMAAASGVRKPVARHLTALAATCTDDAPLSAVLRCFLAIEPKADWQQNSNYTAASIGRSFLDGYGYVEILGPGRVIDCAHVRLGFLLLAPGLTYPEHAHPAEEVYHVVAGTAEWWQDDASGDGEPGWQPKPPGAMIHHRRHVRHAMRTSGEPLLALYAWGGDIGPSAALSASKVSSQVRQR